MLKKTNKYVSDHEDVIIKPAIIVDGVEVTSPSQAYIAAKYHPDWTVDKFNYFKDKVYSVTRVSDDLMQKITEIFKTGSNLSDDPRNAEKISLLNQLGETDSATGTELYDLSHEIDDYRGHCYHGMIQCKSMNDINRLAELEKLYSGDVLKDMFTYAQTIDKFMDNLHSTVRYVPKGSENQEFVHAFILCCRCGITRVSSVNHIASSFDLIAGNIRHQLNEYTDLIDDLKRLNNQN